MEGLLLVDKPSGISSFGVVARVRKIVSIVTGQKVKVGHAGTLDPFASGLLILMIGRSTKQAGHFLKLDKTYSAVVELGKESTTADPEGVIETFSDYRPSMQEVNLAFEQLTGKIMQIPPIYSAIKVNGKRAYQLARKGHDFELKSREVNVYYYQDVHYSYPKLDFITKVSSGTYIRSLAVDLGKILNTGAYLKELRRISIGEYRIEESSALESISPDNVLSKIRVIN